MFVHEEMEKDVPRITVNQTTDVGLKYVPTCAQANSVNNN